MSCEKVYYSDLFKKIANGQKAMLNHGWPRTTLLMYSRWYCYFSIICAVNLGQTMRSARRMWKITYC